LRRSELVNLDVEDIAKTREGIILTLRWSKTDQEGQGTELAIPNWRKPATCPVTILEAWLTWAKIKSGPVLRKVRQKGVVEDKRLSDRAVALILKRCVGHAGFAPEEFSGHSLRAGFATSAAAAGGPRAPHHAAYPAQVGANGPALHPQGLPLQRELG
jgi:integrase